MYSTISTSKSSLLLDIPLPYLRNRVPFKDAVDIQCNVCEFTLISKTNTSNSLAISQNENENEPSDNCNSFKTVALRDSRSIMNQYFEKSYHAFRFDMSFPDPTANDRNNASSESSSKRSLQLIELVNIYNVVVLSNYLCFRVINKC